MRRFKLEILIVVLVGFIATIFAEKLEQKLIVMLVFTLLSAFLLNRFFSPLEKILASIVPYDEDFSSKLSIESLNRKSPFTQVAISLNQLIENAGNHIQHSKDKDREREGILDSLNEGVIALNVLSKVTFVNDKACEMLKVPRVDIIDKSLKEIRESCSLVKKCDDIVAGALQTSQMTKDTWVSEDLFYDLSASSLVHQTGALLVIQDKTSDWKMVELGKNFIANSSHELRTPITIIRGFAEMLGSDLTPEMTVDITEKIIKTCDRLDNLVKSLLTITDLENFSSKRFEPCNVMSLLDNCKHVLITAYPDVELEISGAKQTQVVLGDFSLLDLAITNLLENAVKYSSAPKKIQVNVEEVSEQVSITIKDHGIGIPLKDLPHIFDRFYRVDKARTRKSGGTGLGLSMVKLIIEKHKGDISVDSVEGRGSSFCIKMPLQKNPVPDKDSEDRKKDLVLDGSF